MKPQPSPIWLLGSIFLLITACDAPWYWSHKPVKAPTFSKAQVSRGQQVFENNCLRCHGSTGKGDGPDAERLNLEPANLLESKMNFDQNHVKLMLSYPHPSPEMMKQTIAHGRDKMPAWNSELSEQEIQDLVHFLSYLQYQESH